MRNTKKNKKKNPLKTWKKNFKVKIFSSGLLKTKPVFLLHSSCSLTFKMS